MINLIWYNEGYNIYLSVFAYKLNDFHSQWIHHSSANGHFLPPGIQGIWCECTRMPIHAHFYLLGDRPDVHEEILPLLY